MAELHLLAYAFTSVGGAPQIGGWCPWCQRVHWHGDTGGQRERRGGGDHCFGHPYGNGYALVRVGRITSPSRIPRLNATETLAMSRLLERAFISGAPTPAETARVDRKTPAGGAGEAALQTTGQV